MYISTSHFPRYSGDLITGNVIETLGQPSVRVFIVYSVRVCICVCVPNMLWT